jgi:hypothetical protein
VCNAAECRDGAVDCLLSSWYSWFPCTLSCGRGTRTRFRNILQPPDSIGQPCGNLTESASCNTQPCPINCAVSEWSDWSACTAECGGGAETRRRTIVVPAAFGGADCPGLAESKSCNTVACPVSCVMSEWAAASNCSAVCGGGVYREERRVVVAPNALGARCPPDVARNVSCNTQACPVDCRLSEWSSWGGCSAGCGGGMRLRTRSVEMPALYGGAACGPQQEQGACNTGACRVDCVMGEYGEPGPCNATCGGGYAVMERSVVVAASGGGTACGATTRAVACNTQACPVDCEVGEWGGWGVCSAGCGGGTQVRERDVVVAAQYGGAACGATVETRGCNTQACPVDCVMSSWTGWSSCVDAAGDVVVCGANGTDAWQRRQREVVVGAQHGGNCSSVVEEAVACGQSACPVDCVVSEWSAWSNCTAVCGTGTRRRGREIEVIGRYGGDACPDESGLEEVENCVLPGCPVDCALDEWSVWSACTEDCGGGMQTRTRDMVQQALNGGRVCQGALVEQGACNAQPCPVDCVMGEWSAWSACDSAADPCGTFPRVRTREVNVTAQFGGVACPELGYENETQACPETRQCPRLCLASWTSWSACSAVCNGTRIRFRNFTEIPARDAGDCDPVFDEAGCKWNCEDDDPCLIMWTSWRPCPANCTGTTTRRRDFERYAPDAPRGVCNPPFVETMTCVDYCASLAGSPGSAASSSADSGSMAVAVGGAVGGIMLVLVVVIVVVVARRQQSLFVMRAENSANFSEFETASSMAAKRASTRQLLREDSMRSSVMSSSRDDSETESTRGMFFANPLHSAVRSSAATAAASEMNEPMYEALGVDEVVTVTGSYTQAEAGTMAVENESYCPVGAAPQIVGVDHDNTGYQSGVEPTGKDAYVTLSGPSEVDLAYQTLEGIDEMHL